LDDALKLDYLNAVLSDRERTLFEKHLAACPECRRQIAELRKTAAAVASLTPPSVPATWTDAAKNRLRATSCSAIAGIPLVTPSTRRRTDVFQYAVIAAGVIAGLVLFLWLAMGGTVQPRLPGLSTALGISEPRAARTLDLVTWILSLHAIMFVPAIIDNIYLLVRRGSRRRHLGSSAGSFAR
jgi:hypothetical protein